MSRIGFDEIATNGTVTTGSRTVTNADIEQFAALSGDRNPLHTDDKWVRENTPYPGRIAHGLLGVAITSGLPSEYDDWNVLAFLQCTRKFLAPILPGDTMHAEYVVSSKRVSSSNPEVGVVTLAVNVVNQSSEIVQTGEDVVLVARERTGQ